MVSVINYTCAFPAMTSQSENAFKFEAKKICPVGHVFHFTTTPKTGAADERSRVKFQS